MRVREATLADVDAAADVLSTAHEHYAWAVWAFPGPDRRARLRGLFRADLALAVSAPGDGTVWVVDDGGVLATVAMWRPPWPRAYTPEALAAHEAASAPLIGDDGDRLDAADARTRHAHPPAPNWYLGTVGTHPDHRRRGLAAAVVEPVLTRCDADGTVAFLETSSDDNVRGYRRLGFEVVFETVTSDGVLPLYVMHRTPVTRAR